MCIAARIGFTLVQLAIFRVEDQPGITAPLMGPRTILHRTPGGKKSDSLTFPSSSLAAA